MVWNRVRLLIMSVTGAARAGSPAPSNVDEDEEEEDLLLDEVGEDSELRDQIRSVRSPRLRPSPL
jgi:hypothetical protein